MENHEEAVSYPGFKDRKTGLVLFGIFEIIISLVFALLAFVFIGYAVFHKSFAAQAGTVMTPYIGLFYALLAVWFMWMGIGSIKARRWARALLLVSSWLWFSIGIGVLVFLAVFMPDMQKLIAQKGQMSESMASNVKYAILGTIFVIYIVVPGVLILFYGSKNVKATCEFRNPQISWTDKCPLPVLAVSLIYVIKASSPILVVSYGNTIPFFGYILNGAAAAGMALVIFFLSCYIAWGAYKLNIKAWWCALVFTFVWTLSSVVTFLRVNIWDFYEKMNLSTQQMEMMRQYAMPQSSMVIYSVILGAAVLGYLLYTRRYFITTSAQ